MDLKGEEKYEWTRIWGFFEEFILGGARFTSEKEGGGAMRVL